MKDNLHKQIEDILKNQALSQINPSIIADEVLKLVVEKIEEQKIKEGFSEISGSYNSALNDILSALIK